MLNAQKYIGLKLPKFSGKTNEDVVKFSINFKRAAHFHKWEESRKTKALIYQLQKAYFFYTGPKPWNKTLGDFTKAQNTRRGRRSKESVAEPKPVDWTAEILQAVAKLKTPQAPNVDAYEISNATPNPGVNTQDNQMLNRSETTQLIQQELHRANGTQRTGYLFVIFVTGRVM